MTTKMDLANAVRTAQTELENGWKAYHEVQRYRDKMDKEYGIAQANYHAFRDEAIGRSRETYKAAMKARRALSDATARLSRYEANELAFTDDDGIMRKHLTIAIAQAVRGKFFDEWADAIVGELDRAQSKGGLLRAHIESLSLEDDTYFKEETPPPKALTEKQVKRVWDVLTAICPLRRMQVEKGTLILGTPYPVPLA